ncbi:glycosyltransferase family 4 protein [Aestuariirhabdus sp. Z084]|uniref:glycosyltransferase family 4 protein n=1 Tax=Aestuariirhabdus haliotis TaxID=2918751 RepID=UPI00201B36A9|nr:glycosyltransferase family 4 protein [Aestuariirhabdus haliotis]MCL6416514.1 glycosyltransferase family 4 protein [Aestuariirhabdus haliotis]MCL6420504.1 glycosyltransferase family 4 protein [Aestuariirhabdus haliotis]
MTAFEATFEHEARPISRPLRIALLGYRSDPFVGGQGIYLKFLSKALVELGHQVDVLSGPPYPDLDPRVGLIRIPSLDLFACDSHVKALRWRHLRSYSDTFEWCSMLTGGFSEPYTFSRRVAKYLRSSAKPYDLVHDNQSLGYGLLTLQRRGIPVVTTIHHPIHRDRQLALDAAPNWKFRLLVRRWHSFLRMQEKVVSQLTNVVTVSEQSRQDISGAFGICQSRIDLIHNGIDTQTFTPNSEVAVDPWQLITTASADQPLKGLRFLLQALAQLRPDFPQLKLLVVGKLQPSGTTARLIDKLELASAVRFVSGISTEALVEHYNRSAIAISPSLYEGFGLPAGEAMACGCAVISSDGGALPEVVGDAGMLVPAGDSGQLANGIATLLRDPELRKELGLRGRARVVERFSWQRAAIQFSNYYYRVIANADG